MKIGFDFDDVIYNFSELIRQEILKKYNFDVSSQWNDGFEVSVPGVDDKVLSKFIYNCMSYKMSKGTEMPNSLRELEQIHKDTKEPICIITSRPRFTKTATEKWLSKNLKAEFTVDYSNSKPKTFYIKERGLDIFVDDRLTTLNDIADANICKHLFLYDRPWNRNKTLKSNIKRIKNLEEVRALLDTFKRTN